MGLGHKLKEGFQDGFVKLFQGVAAGLHSPRFEDRAHQSHARKHKRLRDIDRHHAEFIQKQLDELESSARRQRETPEGQHTSPAETTAGGRANAPQNLPPFSSAILTAYLASQLSATLSQKATPYC